MKAETRLRFTHSDIPHEVRSRGTKAVAEWVRKHGTLKARRPQTRSRMSELFRQLGPRPDVTRMHERVIWEARHRDLWPEIRHQAKTRLLESYRAADELDRQIAELRRNRAS